MKTLLLVAALLSTNAIANTQNKEFETCKSLEGLAGSIMQARQDNRSMSELIELTRDNAIGTMLVIDAYKQPVYRAVKNKSIAVKEFKNVVFKACYNELVAKKI